MDSIGFVCPRLPGATSALHHHQLPCILTCQSLIPRPPSSRRRLAISAIASSTANSTPLRSATYTVCDFMTKMEDLHVVKTTTTIDEALDTLVDKRITAFPVIDDDSKLVGVVSDYDLLALDSISGCGEAGANIFPDVHSSWKFSPETYQLDLRHNEMPLKGVQRFNEIQRLLSKTNGKVVGDMMTPDPLVVRETANLEDAVRKPGVWEFAPPGGLKFESYSPRVTVLLIETKYHRLPVIDGDGRLVGIITRGNVVTAALQIRRASKRMP
ncbi:unnamed protein product [Camellia sinensis]